MGRFSAVDNGRSSITCMDFSYDSLAVEKLWRVLVLGILRKQTWAVWLLIVLRFRKFLIQEKEEEKSGERIKGVSKWQKRIGYVFDLTLQETLQRSCFWGVTIDRRDLRWPSHGIPSA